MSASAFMPPQNGFMSSMQAPQQMFPGPQGGIPLQNGFMNAMQAPQQMMTNQFASVPGFPPNQFFGQPALVSSQMPPMVQTSQQSYFPQAKQVQSSFDAAPIDEAHAKRVSDLNTQVMEANSKVAQLDYEVNMQMTDPGVMRTELQITALAQELVQLRTKAEALEEQCHSRKAEVDRQSVQSPYKMVSQSFTCRGYGGDNNLQTGCEELRIVHDCCCRRKRGLKSVC